MRERATRATWKALPLPARSSERSVDFALTPDEYARLRYGSIPEVMEDKWFVYEAARVVHFHRSWTGHCIGTLRFEKTADGYRAVSAVLNRDPEQYTGDDEEAAALLERLARQVAAANAAPPAAKRPHDPDRNRRALDELFAGGRIALERSPLLDRAPAPLPPDLVPDRLEGMLLGLAVGDALGNTSEGAAPRDRRARFGEITHYLPHWRTNGRPRGLPSDDTQMAFWTLEQLNADGGLRPEFLSRRLSVQHLFGIGQSVKQFVRRAKDEGLHWALAGVPSAGNGALMRIAPIVVPHLRAPTSALWADAALAAMLTHNDRASTATCVAFVALLWSALGLRQPPPNGFWLDRFLEVATPLEGPNDLEPRFGPHVGRYKGPLTAFVRKVVPPALEADRPVLEAGDEWGSGAYLLETVPTVLHILERHAHDPREAILRAVNDTRDNDTIAAIVGSLVGALHGAQALPQEWKQDLLGRTAEDDDGYVFDLIEEAKSLWAPTGERG